MFFYWKYCKNPSVIVKKLLKKKRNKSLIIENMRIMIETYTKENGGESMEDMTEQKSYKTLRIIASILSVLALIAIIAALIIVNGLKIQNSTLVVNADGEAVLVDKDIAKAEEEAEKACQEELKRQEEEALEQAKIKLMEDADFLAATYDYDGAIALVEAFEDYTLDTRLTDKIAEYEAIKATCVPVNIKEVTHIFYHSLVVDPERAFANQEKNPQAVGNNQWMTTISEFEKITQEMYDRGYVMVSIHDLYEEVVDENGETKFVEGTIMLPPDKKAFVLSLDDLSYYHSYDGYGYASKIILDENGELTCEYIQADGTVVTGAYDVVPLMDAFVKEHPDASYKGAKGIIALTGYNGILGYRTDISYTSITDDLDYVKKVWIKEHPDFDIEAERAEAKKVAEAMMENGWEFASHTWGHLRVGDASLERLQRDTQKWLENVAPLIGGTDTIIFAHGQDLGKWGYYDESNEKYQYLREQGFNIFCNVDASRYATWLGDDYLRQGRRNLDGYRIYYNAIGEQNNVSDIFDASEILDPQRPPVPPL